MRGRGALHRQGKRADGDGTVEAFGEQGVVGSVLRQHIEAAALRRVGILNGRDADHSGVFHRVAKLRRLSGSNGADAGIEA